MKATLSIATSLVVALVGAAGCDEGPCSGVYHCPAEISSVSLPSDSSATVTSASGDTCTTLLDVADGLVEIGSSAHQPCHVRIQLRDGSTRESVVTFEALMCCGYTLTATPFDASDGGASG